MSIDVGVLGVRVGVGVVLMMRVLVGVTRQQLLLGRVRVLLVVGRVPTSVDPQTRILAVGIRHSEDRSAAVLKVAVKVFRGTGGQITSGLVSDGPLSFVEDDAGKCDQNEGEGGHNGNDPSDGGPLVAVVDRS